MAVPPLHGEDFAPSSGAMPLPDSHRFSASSPPFDPEGALDALDEPLCVVSTAWRLLYMNRAFAELAIQGGEVALTKDLREIFPSLGAGGDSDLSALANEGKREWRISHFGKPPRSLDLRATRLRDDGVLIHIRDLGDADAIERALAERDEENAAMREVTNALAREADLDPLLHVICAQASAQCDASGATVVRLTGERGHVVSASGSLGAMLGSRFPLAGSLTERAIHERGPVRVDDYRIEHPRFRRTAEEFEIGPALFAPLVAHNHMLGAMTVAPRHSPRAKSAASPPSPITRRSRSGRRTSPTRRGSRTRSKENSSPRCRTSCARRSPRCSATKSCSPSTSSVLSPISRKSRWSA